MSDADPLAAFWVADPLYTTALLELAAHRLARDEALLQARRAGMSPADLAAVTGLTRGQVRHMLGRAAAAEAAMDDVSIATG